ncbi:Holliday junction ATP-dependent DNA helicase RuvA [bioreactor metagenome]|uniref:Holliday junction ATP-dependent DNA helicase RuvA n=1 Tax=bioreactor metagenome TaxID=1076179 RepID=A0A644V4C3_9ZZZZ|nr:Holliday junction branch migration protein RuvA [Acidaminococcaceae bacterium]NLU44508.1 Holliday junction branch migration protein RuvA [Acholeplasmataceae bacterium]
MIGFIKGNVDYLANDHCIVDNNGIGYRIFMPFGQLSLLKVGQEVKAFTYLAVRDDALLLYGFLTRDYYSLFLQLISVSGVGPKVALGMLSAAKPDEFYLAIQSRDLKFLTKLPGIGKKTAERLLLELKDKIGSTDGDDLDFVDSTGTLTGTVVDDAMAALVTLGYTNSEIIPVIKQIQNRYTMKSEEIIRQALKLMARR